MLATITKSNDHTKGIDSWIRGKGMKSLLVGQIHHLNEVKDLAGIRGFLISTSNKTFVIKDRFETSVTIETQ